MPICWPSAPAASAPAEGPLDMCAPLSNPGEAADLPGAVVEYDSDDEGSVAEDEAMEDEATEVKTEADLDPGEEEADYQYMETDSLWARLVTAEAVHSAITRPFFKAAVDDAYALSGVAFALATHRWRIANLCADLH